MREQEPPALALRPPADAGDEDAEGLNWELTSLLSALPIQYSYSDSAPDLSPCAAPIVTLPAGDAGPGPPGKETLLFEIHLTALPYGSRTSLLKSTLAHCTTRACMLS